ncbi:DsrE family protein [Novipirellula artificiosorum]|uniref:DsrE/DsrF-like family protein n=1 Tax=Novipirellula artificiosorum TaxID=2528016 RepID=A0A5C6DAW0_9BACT|nr:DsrE family protein [Novipirellula artificiosorum]TWU31999.1 DsrE/DsrF-like family protein [Novipirellula artificiosorum]
MKCPTTMKSALLAITAAIVGTCVANADEPTTPPTQKPTLVINLTSGAESLHSVMMGLHFAEHGLADGREVVIFFNVKSPPLARKTLSDDVRFEEMPSVRSTIADLLKQGAKMIVCPMCAKVTGVEADDLAPGIQLVEDRKQIFDHLHADSVVFTY